MNIKMLMLFLWVHTISIYAVIVNGSRRIINNKVVILLGDYHQRTLHDDQQIKLIENYLKKKDTQCFFEGLPVKRMNFFDVYKKTIELSPLYNNSEKSFDLDTQSFLYYEETLQEVEKEQLECLSTIAKYSQDLQAGDNLLSTFMVDFAQLNPSYNLFSLLSFFGKKYCLGYLNRHVIDMRFTFQLLAAEVDEKSLDTKLLEAYLKKIFKETDKKYRLLLEKLKKRKRRNKDKQFNALCSWYEKELKRVCDDISLYSNTLENQIVSHNMYVYFSQGLNKLFNFDCLVYLLNAIFFEKNKTVLCILGRDHIDWIEKVLLLVGYKPKVQYETAENEHYKPSLQEQIENHVKNNSLDKELILKFIKDTKQKLERDQKQQYYYDSSALFSVPLKLIQLSNLLYPSLLNQKAMYSIDALQKGGDKLKEK